MESFKSPEAKTLEAVEIMELRQSVSHAVCMAEDHLTSLILPIIHPTPFSNIPDALLSHLHHPTTPLPESLPDPIHSKSGDSQTTGDEEPHQVLSLCLSIFWEARECTTEMLQIAG